MFDAVLFKDIVKRHHIRFGSALENLATWLISNIANDFSFNILAKQSQISSVHTVQKYIGYLEEAFIFFTIPRFSYKLGEQQKSNKKIYCFDNGFYKAKGFQFNNDYGKLLENVIAIELIKRTLIKASKELRCNRLVVITNNHEARDQVNWFGIEGEIEYIPARKWLLG